MNREKLQEWIRRNFVPVIAGTAVALILFLGIRYIVNLLNRPAPAPAKPAHEKAEDPDAIHYLVVHHSVSGWGSGAAVVEWHTGPPPHRNWDLPGYHAVIGNGYPTKESWKKRAYDSAADGRVDRIVSESLRVNGVRFGNKNALQVCLIGDLDRRDPTEKQMAALINLLTHWCIKYGLDPRTAIIGHGEMQEQIGLEGYSKTCPGERVDMDAVRAAVLSQVIRRLLPHGMEQ